MDKDIVVDIFSALVNLIGSDVEKDAIELLKKYQRCRTIENVRGRSTLSKKLAADLALSLLADDLGALARSDIPY